MITMLKLAFPQDPLYLSVIVLVIFSKINGYVSSSLCPQNCTCTWSSGVVTCSGMGQIPSFSDRSQIHELTLSPNNLAEIKAEDFRSFTNLHYLDLSRGNIKYIAENAFEDIKEQIERINLDRNQLEFIPGELFKNMPRLKDLELNSNRIRSLNGSLFVNLTSLNIAKFDSNRLSKIDAGVFQNVPSLETLYLKQNQLTEIPYSTLQNIPTLKSLRLGFNKVSSFGTWNNFQWINLSEIALDSNLITDLNVFPDIAPNLEILDLGFNMFSSVKESIWTNINSLKSLDLNGNKMRSLNSGIFGGLEKLEKLFMRNMPVLERIGPRVFTDLKKLQYIDLSVSPNLKYVHEDAFQATSLTTLYLDHNNLTTLSQNALPLHTLGHLSLRNNSWNCDCKLRWILNENITYNSSAVKSTVQNVICSSPTHLKGKLMKSLETSDLVCSRLSPSSGAHSRIATGIIVAVVCLGFFTILALFMKFRKPIIMRARKYYMYKRFKADGVFTVGNEAVETELDDVDLL